MAGGHRKAVPAQHRHRGWRAVARSLRAVCHGTRGGRDRDRRLSGRGLDDEAVD